MGGADTFLVLCKDLGFCFEFINWCLNPCNDRASPSDATRFWWHVLWDWGVALVVTKELVHLLKFMLVSDEHVLVLSRELLFNFWASLDVLELRK